MTRKLLLALPLLLIPSLASAQSGSGPGSGTDMFRVLEESRAMMRDGRHQRHMEEMRAYRLDFERRLQEPEATATVPAPATRQRRR